MQDLKNKIDIILNNFNKGNHLDALNQIEGLLKLNKNNINLLFTYGVMCTKVNQNEKANNIFKKILLINPDHKKSINYDI